MNLEVVIGYKSEVLYDSYKEKMDILHGSIWNKLPMYALPVAATGILEQLFNASDVAKGESTGRKRCQRTTLYALYSCCNDSHYFCFRIF